MGPQRWFFLLKKCIWWFGLSSITLLALSQWSQTKLIGPGLICGLNAFQWISYVGGSVIFLTILLQIPSLFFCLRFSKKASEFFDFHWMHLYEKSGFTHSWKAARIQNMTDLFVGWWSFHSALMTALKFQNSSITLYIWRINTGFSAFSQTEGG